VSIDRHAGVILREQSPARQITWIAGLLVFDPTPRSRQLFGVDDLADGLVVDFVFALGIEFGAGLEAAFGAGFGAVLGRYLFSLGTPTTKSSFHSPTSFPIPLG
jgi:hypothetical protein